MRKQHGLQGRPDSRQGIFEMLIEGLIDGGPGRNAIWLAVIYPALIAVLYLLNSVLTKIH